MRLVELTDDDRAALEAARHATHQVREWRRLQAVHLLDQGRDAPEVAAALDCSASSVYYWADDLRDLGLAGLAEGPHDGRPRRLDAQAEALLEEVVGTDPQTLGYAATDWTAPLLLTELTQRGYTLSARTLRRTLHRRGWRWKRPKYVLGRPDPDYEAKKGR